MSPSATGSTLGVGSLRSAREFALMVPLEASEEAWGTTEAAEPSLNVASPKKVRPAVCVGRRSLAPGEGRQLMGSSRRSCAPA